MKKSAVLQWLEQNSGAQGFEESVSRLVSYACLEWIRRECGIVLNEAEALSWFLLKVPQEYPLGLWLGNVWNYLPDIAEFCENAKNLPIPSAVKQDFPDVLDLRGVKCPLNSARSRLVMNSYPDGRCLNIYLDEGSPIENVPGSLVADGHIIESREKKENYWILKVKKASNKV